MSIISCNNKLILYHVFILIPFLKESEEDIKVETYTTTYILCTYRNETYITIFNMFKFVILCFLKFYIVLCPLARSAYFTIIYYFTIYFN